MNSLNIFPSLSGVCSKGDVKLDCENAKGFWVSMMNADEWNDVVWIEVQREIINTTPE